jgi:Tol biopolymer transport system component
MKYLLASLGFLALALAACGSDGSGGDDDGDTDADAGLPLAPTVCRAFVSIAPSVPGTTDGPSSLWRWGGSSATELRAGLFPHTFGLLSPDGTRIAYRRGDAIVVDDVAASGAERIIEDESPQGAMTWAGDELAVVVFTPTPPDRPFGIDVVSPATGARRELLPQELGDIDSLKASVDGALVGFVRDAKLWQVPTAGGEVTSVAPVEDVEGFVGWSASGRFVAFTRHGDGVHILELATGSETYVGMGYYVIPSWSPVDDRLFFESLVPEGAHGDYRASFWIVDADGANERLLDAGQLLKESPSRLPTWSLDGSEIAWHGVPVEGGVDRGPHPLLTTDAVTGTTAVVHHDWPDEAVIVSRCEF